MKKPTRTTALWSICLGLWMGCTSGSEPNTPSNNNNNNNNTVTVTGDAQDALAQRGFALTPSEVQQPSGNVQATFNAPVGDINAAPAISGSAQVTVEAGAPSAWLSVGLLDSQSDPALFYLLFENQAVATQQLVVAARAADVVAGATLTVDGDQAAILLFDNETGEASMGLSGTFTVSASNLVSGGTLDGSLDVTLTPVTLEDWPEAFFPLTYDGTVSERVPASAQGAFSLTLDSVDTAEPSFGSADVTATVEGFAPFTASTGYAYTFEDGYVQLAFVSELEQSRGVVVVLNTNLLAPGQVALGTYDAMAWFIDEDGTQVAFTGGVLTLDVAGSAAGSNITGSLQVSGEGMVFRCEGDCRNEQPEEPIEEPASCSEDVAAVPQNFVATEAYLETMPQGAGPAGYDRVLYVVNSSTGAMFGTLIPSDAVLESTATVSLGWVDFEGQLFSAAVYGFQECQQSLEVDSGTLTLTTVQTEQGNILTGSGTTVTRGITNTLAFEVPVLPAGIDGQP